MPTLLAVAVHTILPRVERQQLVEAVVAAMLKLTPLMPCEPGWNAQYD